MTLPDGKVIPPTGKAFDVEFGQTTKWEGDRLIVISAFFDAALQAKQLGLAGSSEGAPWSTYRPGSMRRKGLMVRKR